MLQIIKCNDTSCCSPARSSYFSVIKDRFLPPPMPIVQTVDGLVTDIPKQQFAPLFLTIQLGNAVLPARTLCNFPKGIPYDFGCPSLQEELHKRICSECGHYAATVVSLNKHLKVCQRGREIPVIKVRPVHIAARRTRKLMCAINYLETTELEWYDEEHVDTAGLEEPPISTIVGGTPIIQLEDRSPI